MDMQNRKLAKVLVDYSVKVKKGEKVMIDCSGDASRSLLYALIEEILKKGAVPYYNIIDERASRILLKNGSQTLWKEKAKIDLAAMKAMDAYIAVRGADNIFQLAGVPQEKIAEFSRHYIGPVHIKERVENTRWVVLRYPSPSFAQSAFMSDEEFEKFYFKVCTLDYKKLSKAMDPLVRLLTKTETVQLKGRNTDLTIGVKGMNWIKCDGNSNIPDGEVFSSPVKNEVNGHIAFNTKTVQAGEMFSDIEFEVKNGKIIEAGCSSGNAKKLNELLDTDKGSRYFGEFAFGTNPYINREILDILFDEKINGSNHLAVGNSYKECFNGNRSAVHWDLIIVGCDVYCDGTLIRKGKKFIHPSLKGLNSKIL